MLTVSTNREGRLIYAWVMLDQETSLFSDTKPIFDITELAEPLPSPEELWQAKTWQEWSNIFDQAYEDPTSLASITSKNSRPMTLKALFKFFLDDGIISKRIELTPLHLRLLLLPIQGVVHQARELLSCFSSKAVVRRGSKNVTAASSRVQLRDASALLRRWFILAERYMWTKTVCPMMQASLILFHLVSLNTIVSLPEIERLARRDELEMTDKNFLHSHCSMDTEEAIVHCGQILRIVRSMSPWVRPPWWAGAVYRVALTLWTVTLLRRDAVSDAQHQLAASEYRVPVDVLPPQHAIIAGYLADKKGIPHLTQDDSSPLFLDSPVDVLVHCVGVIASGTATMFTDGLRIKLSRLAQDVNRHDLRR